MEIKFLEDFYDNMSLIITECNFLAVEDDHSIVTFKTNSRRVAFNLNKNSFNEEFKKEIIDLEPIQVIACDSTDDDLGLDPTFKNTNATDNTITTNKRVTRLTQISKEDSKTTTLESSEGDETLPHPD